MAAKAIRWSTQQIDEYVRKRKARMANAEFDREMIAPVKPLPSNGTARAASASRAGLIRAPIAGRLYPLVLLCEAHGLPLPQPEYNFSPLRGWRFDYAFVDPKIAVEIEGGVWRRGGGAHSHPLGILRDIEKYNAAAILGWRILRVVPEKLADIIEPLREIFNEG